MTSQQPVAAGERTLAGRDFLLLWAGAGIALTEIWAGGLLAPLGLTAGLLVIVLGHFIGNTPFALAGLIGSRHGVPSMVSTRGAMGVRGSYLPALLNIVQLVGWTAVMLWVGGQAAARLTQPHTGLGAPFWIVVGGVLTTAWTLGGHRLWQKLQVAAVLLLVALSFIMTYLLLKQHGWQELMQRPAPGGLTFMGGLDLVIAMPISWLPLAADYARYAQRSRGAFLGSWLGYFLASSWMYAVGLAAAIATGTGTPDAMVMDLLASYGLAAGALLVILISTFTTTFLDIYSNAISILSLAPRIGERTAIVTGGVLGTVSALFLNPLQYEHFLLFIGSAFCPLFGVVFADYFIRHRGHYEADQLFAGPRYWYRGGFHLPGLLAWAAGFGLYHLCAQRFTVAGASLPGMLGAAFLYLLFTLGARRTAVAPST
jgi:NCS1 family nucleobase:cation symporter-1